MKVDSNLFLFSSVFCVLSFCSSCHKIEEEKDTPEPEPVTTDMTKGLPSGFRTVNGYLYAYLRADYYSGSAYNYAGAFAAFGDPARNLVSTFNHYNDQSLFNGGNNDRGNISQSNIRLNGMTLSSAFSGSGNIAYQYNNSGSTVINYSTNWKSDGNKSFKPFDLYVTRGFPVVNAPQQSTLSLSSDNYIEVSNYVSNYDSVVVRVSYSTLFNAPAVQKVAVPGSGVLIKASELSSLFGGNSTGFLSFRAYNYSSKIIADKLYLFELSTKIDNRYVVVKQ